MSTTYLTLVRPFVTFLPDVQSPGRQIYFQEKLVWTFVCLLIYLVCSQVPLFGIMSSDTADPLYWMRMMMASNRGTLMDLGISPVITSSMIMQAITQANIINVNFSIKEDRILYQAASKLLALLMTLGQAVAQVLTGFYGNPKGLGTSICFMLVLQLMFSGIIIILLDEVLSKGYGMGSGVNLFIVANICENIFWKAFSPKVFNTARGVEFEGVLVGLVHVMFSRKNKINALYEICFRENLPNMYNLVSTALLFSFVIYFHGFRVELPLSSTQVKGQTGRWPIKLFYSSTTPIIIQSYIISHVSTVSRLLFSKFPSLLIVRLLGVWEMSVSRNLEPISGLCYYIYAPNSMMDIFRRPIHFTIYLTFMLLSGAFMSRAWIDMNDLNAESVAKQLKNQKMTIKGISESNVASYLNKYIPTAAFLGGFIISGICVFSNLMDTIGSGTNIILAVGIIWQYFEAMTKETMKKGGLVFAD